MVVTIRDHADHGTRDDADLGRTATKAPTATADNGPGRVTGRASTYFDANGPHGEQQALPVVATRLADPSPSAIERWRCNTTT